MSRRQRPKRRRLRDRTGRAVEPNVVVRVLRCADCGEAVLHVELWVGDEPAYGAPLAFLICDECGGTRYPEPEERRL